jgi:hypothetical protein
MPPSPPTSSSSPQKTCQRHTGAGSKRHHYFFFSYAGRNGIIELHQNYTRASRVLAQVQTLLPSAEFLVG